MTVFSEIDSSLNTYIEKAKKVLKAMYLTRFMDDKMGKLVRQNKGGTFHLAVSGHEMIGALCANTLIPGTDWGFPYYRDRAFAIGLGCKLEDILGAFLARDVPHHSGGRMMPEHFSDKGLNIPCQSSVVGSQYLQAVGVAKGIQLQGKEAVVYVSGGEGSTSQGDFHEALNFSCIHNLAVVFVIQDNGWAISVPIQEQTAGGSVAKMAQGYEGLKIFDVDGCDYPTLSQSLEEAVGYARKNRKPALVVASVPRLGAHSNSDDPTKYQSKDYLLKQKEKDPIDCFEKYLIEQGMLTLAEIEDLKQRCKEEIETAALHADSSAFPDVKTASDKVFKEVELKGNIVDEPNFSSPEEAVVMVDAINHALDEAMKEDPSLIIFGEDVAHGKGGVFGITRHLTEKYSDRRCFNSPLAESTIIGVATGMSVVEPLKPVVEIQFADYLWTGINQLFNELSSIYYRSNGEWNCPVVVRMPCGGYIQGGPYHSQSIEAFLAHCPGLKVVFPSNTADAKRLLKAAIQDPNPVIFLEHKALYRQRAFCARKEPASDEIIPLGKASIIREGTDITLVTWGMTTFMAWQLAERMHSLGISLEIIDLRTIIPLDIETIITSVKKTSKVLVAHEAAKTCGFGAEIAARIAESCFSYLDAPITRLAAKDCPVPYCKSLEEAVLPSLLDMEEAILKLARY